MNEIRIILLIVKTIQRKRQFTDVIQWPQSHIHSSNPPPPPPIPPPPANSAIMLRSQSLGVYLWMPRNGLPLSSLNSYSYHHLTG